MASTGDTWRLGRRPELDGIRGIAILLVVACHSSPRLAAAGSVGVTLFFTLSGFLITTLLLEEHEQTGQIDLPAFAIRRARRLLPGLVALVAGTSALLLLTGLRSVAVVIRECVPILLYVANWANGDYGSLSHSWSLAVEEQFYAVWPLIFVAVLASRHPRRWLVAVTVAGSLYAVVARMVMWDGGEGLTRVHVGTDMHADGLLVGCLLAVVMHRGRVGTSRPGLAAALVLLLLPLGFVGNGAGRYLVVSTLVPLVGAALIWTCVAGGQVGFLRFRPLVVVGKVSYGVYLWHFPMLFTVRVLIAEIGYYESLFVAWALTAALTWLSWRFVESPFLRSRQASSSGRVDQLADPTPVRGHGIGVRDRGAVLHREGAR